jgi:hypothetical protein
MLKYTALLTLMITVSTAARLQPILISDLYVYAGNQAYVQAYADVTEVSVVSLTSPVRINNTAALTIRGRPGEVYSIIVEYISGQSRASGVTGPNRSKTADSDGLVTWSWLVGLNTTPTLHTIIITEESTGSRIFVPFRTIR